MSSVPADRCCGTLLRTVMRNSPWTLYVWLPPPGGLAQRST